MTTLRTTPVTALACWAEGRLDQMVGFVLPVPLVYAADLVDPDLLDDPEAPAARLVPADPRDRAVHDAVVVVMTDWLVPPDAPRRPGAVAARRRARRVTVDLDGHRAVVTRWEHAPDRVVVSVG